VRPIQLLVLDPLAGDVCAHAQSYLEISNIISRLSPMMSCNFHLFMMPILCPQTNLYHWSSLAAPTYPGPFHICIRLSCFSTLSIIRTKQQASTSPIAHSDLIVLYCSYGFRSQLGYGTISRGARTPEVAPRLSLSSLFITVFPALPATPYYVFRRIPFSPFFSHIPQRELCHATTTLGNFA
jgi:hypothetical protein